MACMSWQVLRVHFDLGGHDPTLFANADLVAVSPGVPLTNEALQQAINCGVPVWGEVEIASREILLSNHRSDRHQW